MVIVIKEDRSRSPSWPCKEFSVWITSVTRVVSMWINTFLLVLFGLLRCLRLLGIILIPQIEVRPARPGCESVYESLQRGRADQESWPTATKSMIARNRNHSRKRAQWRQKGRGLNCRARLFVSIPPLSHRLWLPLTAQAIRYSEPILLAALLTQSAARSGHATCSGRLGQMNLTTVPKGVPVPGSEFSDSYCS
jgi:hypothetical protein